MTAIKNTNKPTTHKTPGQKHVTKVSKKAKNVAQQGGKGGGATIMKGAAAGAVAGAAFGGIAGAAFTDKNTRKTVADNLSKVAKTAGETIKKLDENQDELKKNLSDTTDTLKDTSEPLHKVGTTGSKKN